MPISKSKKSGVFVTCVDPSEKLSELFIVVVPVDAPIEIVVAAPNALMVVAVVLNTLNDVLPVTTLVVNEGEVPNTNAPVPVSSDMTPASSDDVVAANTLNLFAVSAIVPVASGRVIVLLVLVEEFCKVAMPPRTEVNFRLHDPSVSLKSSSILVPKIKSPPENVAEAFEKP